RLHKRIGDKVTVKSNNDFHARMRVVGIMIVNDPIDSAATEGDGLYAQRDTFFEITGSSKVPQSIAVRVDPSLDRATAIESIRRDFPGSIREAQPQSDVRNVGHL